MNFEKVSLKSEWINYTPLGRVPRGLEKAAAYISFLLLLVLHLQIHQL